MLCHTQAYHLLKMEAGLSIDETVRSARLCHPEFNVQLTLQDGKYLQRFSELIKTF